MLGVGIVDQFSKLAARVIEARSGRNSLSVTIEDVNTDGGFAVPIVQGAFGVPYEDKLANGGSTDLNVDGSGTAVEFVVAPDASTDWYITELAFAGRDGSVKFSNFFGLAALTTGVYIEIKADNTIFTFDNLQTTFDIMNWSSTNKFQFFSDANSDSVKGVRTDPFVLRKQGFFGSGNDDYIKFTVNDNLTAIDQLEAIARGVLR